MDNMDPLAGGMAALTLDHGGVSANQPKNEQSKKSKKKTKAERRRAKNAGGISAVKGHFEIHYGSDATKLESWQALCADCGEEPGTSITQCKKVYWRIECRVSQLLLTVLVAARSQHQHRRFGASESSW